jgi:hypothetical protein
MRSDALQNWRREREAVEQEMDRLITEGLPASVEDRLVRQTRFVALVERREAAARKLLQSDWASRRDTSPRASSRPNDHVISAAALPSVSTAVLAAGIPADTAARPADVVAIAPEAADIPAVSAAISGELPADVVPVAASPSDPAEVSAIGVPASADPPDAEALPAASAAGLIVDVPAGAAELPAEVVTPDVAASASVPAVGVPAATADPPTDDTVALAPDVAEAALFARYVAVPTASTHSAGALASPVDAAPLATHAKTTSSDDHDASLLALLRRLQSWRSSTT